MTTQVESAKKGSLTEEMQFVAKQENLTVEKLRQKLIDGRIIITKNNRRDNVKPIAIGEGTKTKVNANIGASPDKFDLNLELKKAEVAVNAGTDTLMDLTVGHGIDEIRKEILKHTDIPFGTVPVYQAFSENKQEMNIDSILSVIEKQCKDGVVLLI